MAEPPPVSSQRWTPARLVSANLARARRDRRWSQGEAAERLARYLGTTWGKATYSAAETGWRRDSRLRAFTADELSAMSLAFAVPVAYWFRVPPDSAGLTVGVPGGESLDADAFTGRMEGERAEVDRREVRMAVLDEIVSFLRAANDGGS